MGKIKKTKVIVREIRPKMKIIESEEEQPVKSPVKEVPLEEVIADAPSSREFPKFSRLDADINERQRGEENQWLSSETESEGAPRKIYQIQGNVGEKEARETYQSSSSQESMISAPLVPKNQRGSFAGRDVMAVEDSRTPSQSDEVKYSVKVESQEPAKKRRYPWEA